MGKERRHRRPYRRLVRSGVMADARNSIPGRRRPAAARGGTQPEDSAVVQEIRSRAAWSWNRDGEDHGARELHGGAAELDDDEEVRQHQGDDRSLVHARDACRRFRRSAAHRGTDARAHWRASQTRRRGSWARCGWVSRRSVPLMPWTSSDAGRNVNS